MRHSYLSRAPVLPVQRARLLGETEWMIGAQRMNAA
jgi:hypothetical protein